MADDGTAVVEGAAIAKVPEVGDVAALVMEADRVVASPRMVAPSLVAVRPLIGSWVKDIRSSISLSERAWAKTYHSSRWPSKCWVKLPLFKIVPSIKGAEEL
jgi:hypothetical protein